MRAVLLAATAICGLAGSARAQLVPAIEPAASEANRNERYGGGTPPGGPSVAQSTPSAGQNGQPIFVPKSLPPPIPTMSPDRPLSRREARNVGMATAWANRACTPQRLPDGTLRFVQGSCEINVVCSPFTPCDVALEPGEVPTDVPLVGDPRIGLQNRPVWSGTGPDKTVHMVFVPSDAGLSSGVVMYTNLRTVNFRVVTHSKRYMPRVQIAASPGGSFGGMNGWAAAVSAGGSGEPCDQPPTVAPSAYRIRTSGWFNGDPPWKPIQVYGVPIQAGTATCIEMPADISGMALPVLVPRDGPSGEASIDNVRVISRGRMRVDRALRAFDLVIGIGGSQEVVSVSRGR